MSYLELAKRKAKELGLGQDDGIETGKIIPFNPFENLHADLWPSLIHCSWCDLTQEERLEWETAIKIQGQAEGAGDTKKWQEMGAILQKIAEAARGRARPAKHLIDD